MFREKAKKKLHKDTMCCFEQIIEAAPHETAALPPISQAMQERRESHTAGELRMNSVATFFGGLLHMDTPMLAD